MNRITGILFPMPLLTIYGGVGGLDWKKIEERKTGGRETKDEKGCRATAVVFNEMYVF